MIPLLKRVVPDHQQRTVKKYKKFVDEINAYEKTIEALSDEALREKTNEFKTRLADGEPLEAIRSEAFAVVREAAKRVLGQRHYDVQLMGGLALSEGNIAEMATGEGKTLVASLPSYLLALEGKGVHVITVNDYLAKRDFEIVGQVHQFLGLTVGLNVPLMSQGEKQTAYAADITYGVGNEFGFDYLRDNIVRQKSEQVQRPFHYAIIDEIDSILVDEAKTPLILAGKTTVSKDLFYITAKLVKTLKKDEHFSFDPETKATSFTDDGITFIEASFGIDNLYDLEHQTLYHYVIQSLRAEIMFKRDEDYIVKEGKIHLVDAFTGRIMEGRSLSNGLHQAIEAKEGLVLTEENKTQAAITIQNYFRKYPLLSGMTGTAKTEEKEFQQIYGMDVMSVPTNKPVIRDDRTDRVFMTQEQKYKAAALEVKALHEKGRPVLIGTTSIKQSELMANQLEALKVPYQLLNAKSVEQEAQMIALAGQKGQVTIATNMAGRGTDILLGDGVKELGGLHVLGTERHESRRIDNQLKGRAGRQGDPGSSHFFVSLEDDLVVRYAEDDLEKMQKSVKPDANGEITDKKVLSFFDRIQRICEGKNYAIREYTLKLDDVVSDQRNIVYHMRDRLFESDDVLADIPTILGEWIPELLERYCPKEEIPEEWNLAELSDKLKLTLPTFTELPKDPYDQSEINEAIQAAIELYKEKLETFKEDAAIQDAVRTMMFFIIDQQWTDHLEAMEHLKEGIGLRGYAQVDPLIMYQEDGLKIFHETYARIQESILAHVAQFVSS